MKYLQTFIRYLKGTAQHFGTTRNLLREVVVSVLTALATGLAIHFLMPDQSPITDLKEILTRTLASQHEADSLRYEHRRAADGAAKQKIIDSLQHEIIIAYERDSILLNAHLSNLDAMRQINRAIDASKK